MGYERLYCVRIVAFIVYLNDYKVKHIFKYLVTDMDTIEEHYHRNVARVCRRP